MDKITVNGKTEDYNKWVESWACWVLLNSSLTKDAAGFEDFLKRVRSGSLSIKIVIDDKLEVKDFNSAIDELKNQFEACVEKKAKELLEEKYLHKMNSFLNDFYDKVREEFDIE